MTNQTSHQHTHIIYMEHIKSSFYFKDKRGDWQVDYHYQSIVTSWGSTYNELKATVLLNNELY